MTPLTDDELAELERLEPQLRALTIIYERDALSVIDVENDARWPVNVHVLDVVAASANALPRLIAELRELRAERDKAQATVTAWHGVVEAIVAHIQDRIAMDDPASPQTYLDIIQASARDVQRDSERIVAARWADYTRHRDANARLEQERDAIGASEARMREALEKAARTFRRYEQLHREKLTDDGLVKARANAAMAQLCEAALSRPASEQKDENDGA